MVLKSCSLSQGEGKSLEEKSGPRNLTFLLGHMAGHMAGDSWVACSSEGGVEE